MQQLMFPNVFAHKRDEPGNMVALCVNVGSSDSAGGVWLESELESVH
jgi:hypothetical protein